jgi:hypothetical protein
VDEVAARSCIDDTVSDTGKSGWHLSAFVRENRVAFDEAGTLGRCQTKLFYSREWQATTIEQFVKVVDSYIRWHDKKRIKVSLGSCSPSNTGGASDLRHKPAQDFCRIPFYW